MTVEDEEDEDNVLVIDEAPLSPQQPLEEEEEEEEDEANISMDVEAPLSPQLPPSPPSPPYQDVRPPPIASPDNILLYDPVEQIYYEVPAKDVRQGEVEVLDVIPVELQFFDEVEEEEDDDVRILAVLPSRRRQENIDGVRRRLFD